MVDKVRIFPPGYVFLDNSGLPLASGTVDVYLEGTSTPSDSYTDQTGGTTNANPVVLDSNGRADIWVDGVTGYKLVIKDSSGTTIKTEDNIFGFISDQLPSSPSASYTTVETTNVDFVDGGKIRDANDNELVILNTTASAINQFEVTNAATGGNPLLTISGGDTNVGMDIQPKGTGDVTVLGTATDSATLLLAEDTDNGTNTIGFKAPAALTASTTFTLPDGDGTSNETLVTNGSGTLSWSSVSLPASDGSANTAVITNGSGVTSFSTLTVVAASQAEQETGTSNTVCVTPGRQHYHQSAAKVWCHFDGTGAISETAYGVSSVTDNGTGSYTVNFSTNFSASTYCAVVTGTNSTTDSGATSIAAVDRAVGSVRIDSESGAGSNTDYDLVDVVIYGDL